MRIASAALAALYLPIALPAAAEVPALYAKLSGTSWEMIEWNGKAPGTPGTPWLSFGRRANFSGKAGCNIYSGNYKVSGERIAFDPSSWTKRMCTIGMEFDPKIGADWRRVTRLSLTSEGILVAHADEGSAVFRFRLAAPNIGD